VIGRREIKRWRGLSAWAAILALLIDALLPTAVSAAAPSGGLAAIPSCSASAPAGVPAKHRAALPVRHCALCAGPVFSLWPARGAPLAPQRLAGAARPTLVAASALPPWRPPLEDAQPRAPPRLV
jgi:hypothetical protein